MLHGCRPLRTTCVGAPCRVNARCQSATENNCWIGADDLQTEGSFQWQDGSEWGVFENWFGSNPDNDNGQQHCVVMRPDGSWDDRACTVTQPAVCTIDYSLCGNGLQDVDQGETGIDCGGFCSQCEPVLSSALGQTGSNVNAARVTFTATFPTAVSGVEVSDFHLNSGGLSVVTSRTSQSGGATDTVWILNVDVVSPLAEGVLSVSILADNTNITPQPLDASNNPFRLVFKPVVATVTTSQTTASGVPRLQYVATPAAAATHMCVHGCACRRRRRRRCLLTHGAFACRCWCRCLPQVHVHVRRACHGPGRHGLHG